MNINKINKLAGLFAKAMFYEKPVDEWLKCLSPDCRVRENSYHEEPYYCYECAKKRKEQGLPEQPEEETNNNTSKYNKLFINEMDPTTTMGGFFSEMKIGNKTLIRITAGGRRNNINYEKTLDNFNSINLDIESSNNIINNIIEAAEGKYSFGKIGKIWGKYFRKDSYGYIQKFVGAYYESGIGLQLPTKLIIDFLTDLEELFVL